MRRHRGAGPGGAAVLGLVLSVPGVAGEGPPWFLAPDPAVPALETYRDWPPAELLERFYALPWGPLAFHRAELFGQPVFFVLTVNWSRAAQRLAAETLANPEIARRLTDGYISVVVNADLRPDIRERYQTGSWPVMALLLPDGRPMLSEANERGEPRPITLGELDPARFGYLLDQGTTYLAQSQPRLLQLAETWVAQESPKPAPPAPADATASEPVATWLLANADEEDGGFGAAPKFLVPGLDEYAAWREARELTALRRHSRRTLERFTSSPLFDRRRGGMHRIALAASFGEIQYEKLLVNNAQLLRELVFSLRSRDSAVLRRALRQTTGFLLETLARPEGGFYLAQAADPRSDDGGGFFRGERGSEPPPIDRLVLAGANATAGAALLRAGTLLDDARVVEAGRGALTLVHERAFRPGRGVAHALEPREEERSYLATQADVALALLDGYETTGFGPWLDAARDIVEFARRNLRDVKSGVFRDALPEPAPFGLLVNPRYPLHPTVRLARAMLRLAAIDHRPSEREEARALLARFSTDLAAYGVHAVDGALAIEEAIGEPLILRIEGRPEDPRVLALRRAAVNSPWPASRVVVGTLEGQPGVVLEYSGKTERETDAKRLGQAILAFVGPT